MLLAPLFSVTLSPLNFRRFFFLAAIENYRNPRTNLCSFLWPLFVAHQAFLCSKAQQLKESLKNIKKYQALQQATTTIMFLI